MCFEFLYKFIRNISPCKKNWARYDKKMSTGLHVKYLLSFSDFKETWIYSAVLRKLLTYQISWNSVQWKPSCFKRTDERTDRNDELNICGSVHHALYWWNKSNKMQQLRFLFAMALLYMFRVTISPIIRSMLYMATGELAHLGCY